MVARAAPAGLDELRVELRELLARYAVKHGRFTLTSGEISDFYVDCRVVATLPRAMRAIGALMLHELDDLPAVQGVGGLSIGADPIAAAVAMSSLDQPEPLQNIPMFMVRKEPKGHGLGKQIEGAFPAEPGAAVVVVDDVITKGGSVLQAIQAIERETQAKVVRVVVILDREEGGAERLRAMGYDVRSIFTRQDFPREYGGSSFRAAGSSYLVPG
jgi:orotate phosphoribosyltransferase